jgi:hypothetical protein
VPALLGLRREEGRRESGGSGRNHLTLNATWINACMVGHEVCQRRRATHGPSAGPVGPCPPWARCISLRPSDFSTTRVVHREDAEASVRWRKAGSTRGTQGVRARNADVMMPALCTWFYFIYPSSKMQNPNFLNRTCKISKYESCRRAIDLQLSQRATYVLINGFVGKTC